jgi:hypothetical protein
VRQVKPAPPTMTTTLEMMAIRAQSFMTYPTTAPDDEIPSCVAKRQPVVRQGLACGGAASARAILKGGAP